MNTSYVCWKCGTSIEALPQPLGRYDICPSCRTELYVCRMCEFYDPQISKGCQEPMAEEVKEKERGNFCNYFQLRPDAFQPADTSATDQARTELDALFGNAPSEDTSPSAEAESTTPSANDRAREELERLFKPSNGNKE